MSVTATLNDEPLLRAAGVGWSRTSGARPHVRTFLLRADRAQRLLGAGAPLQIEVRSGERPPLIVQRLVAVSLQTTDHPDRLGLVVADRRIFWARRHVEKQYNVRRRTGTITRMRVEGEPAPHAPLKDEQRYLPWSLRLPGQLPELLGGGGATPVRPTTGPGGSEGTPVSPGTIGDRWEPPHILADVLGLVGEVPADVEVPAGFASWPAPAVEDLGLDDAGDAAIERALGLIPAVSLELTLDGRVRIYHAEVGGEAVPLAGLGRPLRGSRLRARVSHANLRPTEIVVEFTPEIELRVRLGREVTDPLSAQNVAPSPDQLLQVEGAPAGIVGGTYWPFAGGAGLFAAWATETNRAGQARPFTDALVRRTWYAPEALLGFAGVVQADAIDPRVLNRFGAIRQHYRQTWRLNPALNDVLAAWSVTRLAIYDPETGGRASAQVYGDHHEILTEWGLRNLRKFWRNVSGGAERIGEARIAAPFTVAIVDRELGVFRVAARDDPFSIVGKYGLGHVEGARAGEPVDDPRAQRAGGPGALVKYLGLEAEVAASVIISAIPAVPNGARLYQIRVSPAEASRALGAPIGPCRGPPQTIRVGYRPQTAAWFGWRDDWAPEVVDALGINERGAVPRRLQLLEPTNFDVLTDLARAHAARIYRGLLDREEGGHTSALRVGVAPGGTASAVAHELAPSGVATTTLALPPEVHAVDVRRYLPDATRRFLFQELQPR